MQAQTNKILNLYTDSVILAKVLT